MDPKNRFFTKRTALLLRVDHLVLLAICAALAVQQFHRINVTRFVAAIAWQDLLGYYPAAAAYFWPRKTPGARRIPQFFYVIYNVVHGVPLNAFVLAVWYFARGGWEPAMLAIPIHLCIDRGVFGRYFRSRAIAFEPVEHALFAEFTRKLERQSRWGESPILPLGAE